MQMAGAGCVPQTKHARGVNTSRSKRAVLIKPVAYLEECSILRQDMC